MKDCHAPLNFIIMTFALAALILGIFGSIIGGVVSGRQSDINYQSVKETNEANLQAVRETNQSNVEQAELAYRRSLPVNQVKNLMDAGFSRAGALSTLTGGGTYTAPVLQSSHGEAPQVNLSGLAQSFERLGDIPSNVEQMQLVNQQRKALATDTRIKENVDQRAQELHQYEMWTKLYGKKATEMIDSLSSKIVQDAETKGISLDDIDSTDKLVRTFNLGQNDIWRNMPSSAREQVINGVRAQAAENRARVSAQDVHTAAGDAHDLAELRKQMERVNAKYYEKEKNEQLLNIMRIGEGYIQQNNLTFAELTAQNMENFVREAGIDSEAEAQALAAYAEKLANADEAFQQTVQNQLNNSPIGVPRATMRQILRDFGELLKTVHLSSGKYSVTKKVQVNR